MTTASDLDPPTSTDAGLQRKPFGLLTEALDQLQLAEVYLAPRTGAPGQAAIEGGMSSTEAFARFGVL